MKVTYNYNLYDKVYFLYEGRKCKGYIEEININIKRMERDDYDCAPNEVEKWLYIDLLEAL